MTWSDSSRDWESVRVAGDGRTGAKRLRALATHRDAQVRRLVAEHPHAAPHVLHLLLNDLDAIVRRRVAEHPQCTPDLLDQLAHDGDESVRRQVREHPATGANVLSNLALTTPCPEVAANPHTPTQTLISLAASPKSQTTRGVMWGLCRNPAAPPHLLANLYRRLCPPSAPDIDETAALFLARNPATPAAVLDDLLQREMEDPHVWVALGVHPTMTSEMLERWFELTGWSVHWEVASHRDTPQAAHMTLARLDTDPTVLEAITWHPTVDPAAKVFARLRLDALRSPST